MQLFDKPLTNPEVEAKYKYWRVRNFLCMYFGYTIFYFTRKSFTFAMPSMMEDLSYTKSDLGFLASVMYISYAFSKFIGGILSDRFNPRFFMSAGLMFTGITNIIFGQSSSLFTFAILWALNGFFQGWGFPPCTKQLTYWFDKSQRGHWWSMLSTANNVGGAVIPIVIALASASLGWRWAMYIPGIISIVMAAIILMGMTGLPESVGLPPLEEPEELREAKQSDSAQGPSFWNEVLLNPKIWVLALSFFCIYIVRSAINDWVVLYLHQQKGYSLLEAAGSVSWFEIGGFFGSFSCGWISDRFFRGHRIPYIQQSAFSLLCFILIFKYSHLNHILLENLCLAGIGFSIFGPQALLGLASAEMVDKKIACSAHGLTGGVAYVGAAASGYPLGKIIDIWGWDGFFICLIISSLLLLMILYPSAKEQRSLDLYNMDEAKNPQEALASKA